MLSPALDLFNQTKTFDGPQSNNAGAASLITAGGALDNVEVTGPTIDRLDAESGMARSCRIDTQYLATLGAAETVSLRHRYQTSADNSNWDAAVEIQALTAKGAAGAGNTRGIDSHNLSLAGLKRYIRILTTLDLSRANTDTAQFGTSVVLGGYQNVPVS